MDKETAKSIMRCNPISSRVITIRLKAYPINLTIAQVYVPTTDASDEDLEAFYNTVQEALDKISPRDLVMLMGDWNAKVGKALQKSANMGIYGLGERNQRGEKLLEWCISNDMVIGNTIFPHHSRRLYTWQSPGERVRNQIDYIMVKRRWRSSLSTSRQDQTRTAAVTMHQLLLATAKIKLKTTSKRRTTTTYDVRSIPEACTVAISNIIIYSLVAIRRGGLYSRRTLAFKSLQLSTLHDSGGIPAFQHLGPQTENERSP